MKVGLVTQPFDAVLPPRQNSIGLIMYNTALGLASQVDLTLFMKSVDPDAVLDALPFRVRTSNAFLDDLVEKILTKYPRWTNWTGLRDIVDRHPRYASGVAAGLAREKCDVAHIMNYWQWCRRFKRAGAAVVLEMQSEWLSQMNRRSVAQQLEGADAVVGVSEHISGLFRQAFPEFRGIVASVYNGVDVEAFRPSDAPDGSTADSSGEQRILFVGRLSPEKGVHVLIKAFGSVAEKFPGAVLELAGPRTVLPHRFLVGISSDPLVRHLDRFYDGTVAADYQRHLDALVSRHSVSKKVRFLGPLPHAALVARYQQATILVNPSYSESFGISIVEGMASALPVIGTQVGGMLETVVEGETGLLVPPDDSEALATAMLRVLADTETARRMGASGRARAVEHFSWDARARRLLDVYRAVCS